MKIDWPDLQLPPINLWELPTKGSRMIKYIEMKFKVGDRVRKISGSEWQGIVVGWYSTSLTPEGYAVESESHKGSVQIYPAKALTRVED